MKYIKKYSLFKEADSTDSTLLSDNDKINQDSLKSIQSDISFFKSKKQVMIDTFKDINTSDEDINKNLQSNVYNNEKDVKKRNKYLVEYEGIFRLKRSVDKLSISIENSNGSLSTAKQQLGELTSRFNQVSDESQKSTISAQIEKTRNYVNTVNKTIIDSKKEFSLADKNYQTKIKNFESMMKLEESKIKNLI